MMKVDVIIPTYRPSRQFSLLLQHLQRQTSSVHKILIMNTEEDSAKPKNWTAFVETLDGKLLKNLLENVEVHHVMKSEFDHGGTRHQATIYSDADVFICMTQDALPQNNYLIEELIKPFENGDVCVSYARQLPRKDCSVVEKYTRTFNYPEESFIKSKEDLEQLGIKTFFCSNVCAAYRKETYLEEGGFVRNTIFNEDMIYAGNLILKGKKIAYAANAKVVHSHNYTGVQQFHRNFDLAVSQKDHPEIFANINVEKEGICLVKKTAKHLLTRKQPWLIVDLVIKSGFKFLGYQCGKHYEILPKWWIRYASMNPEYWKSKWTTGRN